MAPEASASHSLTDEQYQTLLNAARGMTMDQVDDFRAEHGLPPLSA